MKPWGESVKSATQSASTAVDELGDVITWFKRDIEGSTAIPQKTTARVRASLALLSESIAELAGAIHKVSDAQSRATLSFMAGNRLTRDQFYILLASECLEWTNKALGLADLEDFELFEMLRFEGAERQGYIYLADDIDDLPDVGMDDWWLGLVSRTYRKAIIPPEDIQWDDLRPEQRAFFEKSLPDAADRFLRDE